MLHCCFFGFLQDANRDGCIGWGEFEAFMMDEFAAGKHLLSGEYVLPSGEHWVMVLITVLHIKIHTVSRHSSSSSRD
jgi:hypothetical protein